MKRHHIKPSDRAKKRLDLEGVLYVLFQGKKGKGKGKKKNIHAAKKGKSISLRVKKKGPGADKQLKRTGKPSAPGKKITVGQKRGEQPYYGEIYRRKTCLNHQKNGQPSGFRNGEKGGPGSWKKLGKKKGKKSKQRKKEKNGRRRNGCLNVCRRTEAWIFEMRQGGASLRAESRWLSGRKRCC